jgi:hypothetical protein
MIPEPLRVNDILVAMAIRRRKRNRMPTASTISARSIPGPKEYTLSVTTILYVIAACPGNILMSAGMCRCQATNATP